jgi:hypothetical protein
MATHTRSPRRMELPDLHQRQTNLNKLVFYYVVIMRARLFDLLMRTRSRMQSVSEFTDASRLLDWVLFPAPIFSDFENWLADSPASWLSSDLITHSPNSSTARHPKPVLPK